MQPTWSFEVRNRCFSLQEVCSDASQEKLSLEVVTALCLAFKISISKAFDQVIETQHKVLMESIISLLNPCHEGTGADPPGGKNDLLFHASSFFLIFQAQFDTYILSHHFLNSCLVPDQEQRHARRGLRWKVLARWRKIGQSSFPLSNLFCPFNYIFSTSR